MSNRRSVPSPSLGVACHGSEPPCASVVFFLLQAWKTRKQKEIATAWWCDATMRGASMRGSTVTSITSRSILSQCFCIGSGVLSGPVRAAEWESRCFVCKRPSRDVLELWDWHAYVRPRVLRVFCTGLDSRRCSLHTVQSRLRLFFSRVGYFPKSSRVCKLRRRHHRRNRRRLCASQKPVR